MLAVRRLFTGIGHFLGACLRFVRHLFARILRLLAKLTLVVLILGALAIVMLPSIAAAAVSPLLSMAGFTARDASISVPMDLLWWQSRTIDEVRLVAYDLEAEDGSLAAGSILATVTTLDLEARSFSMIDATITDFTFTAGPDGDAVKIDSLELSGPSDATVLRAIVNPAALSSLAGETDLRISEARIAPDGSQILVPSATGDLALTPRLNSDGSITFTAADGTSFETKPSDPDGVLRLTSIRVTHSGVAVSAVIDFTAGFIGPEEE
jgi:hypothetical protein